MATDKLTLVVDKKMPNRKQFLALFPWKKIVKFYVIFIFYILIFSVVFFSTEECLRERPQGAADQSTAEKHTENCTKIMLHKGIGIHTHSGTVNNETRKDDDDIVTILKCDKVKKEETKTAKKCQIKFSHVMRWIYFVVVHLHGADTTSFHVTSKWGQIITGPIFVVGMVLAMRLYTMIGFVVVNFINYGVRKLRQRFKKFKVTVKYDILVISTVVFIAYILTCGAISKRYAGEQRMYRETVFQWIMMLLTISDENLIEDSFYASRGGGVEFTPKTPNITQIFLTIFLILFGFLFAVTFFTAIANTMYRLTYNLNAQTKAKKGTLQGWWV